MDKYTDYFTSLRTFKSKKGIVEDLESMFDETISHYTYQKIILHFMESGVISEISERRKKFFISKKTLDEKGTTIEDLFGVEKLGIATNKALQKNTIVTYENYLKADAIEEVTLTELMK